MYILMCNQLVLFLCGKMCLPVQCWFFTITINWWNVLVLFLRIFSLRSKNRKYNMIQLNLFKIDIYFWHFFSCSYFQDVSICSLAKSLTMAIECMLFVRMVGVIGIWLSERMLSILLKCFQSTWFYLKMSIKSKCQQYAQGCETKYRANQEHCSVFSKTKILSKFKIPLEVNWIANDIIPLLI